jgi:hypothetical protein
MGDAVMGTQMRLEYRAAADLAISAAEFREWVDRIEAASGMTRTHVEEIEEEPIVTSVDIGELLGKEAVERIWREIGERWLTPLEPPPTEMEGIPISGWDSLGSEMEVTIVAGSPLRPEERVQIEDMLQAWVEHGTVVGFGGGCFHGWIDGEWESERYHLDVDSGAQVVDWSDAISDLARRVAQLRSVVSASLSISLGSEAYDG